MIKLIKRQSSINTLSMYFRSKPKINFSSIKQRNNANAKGSSQMLSSKKSSTRFQKNKNKVQTNKENLQLRKTLMQKTVRQTMCDNISKRLSVGDSIRNQRYSMAQTHRMERITFEPRNKKQISNKFTRTNKSKFTFTSCQTRDTPQINNFYQDKVGLQRLLKKNKLMGQRCLVGLNIPLIQSKYQFSRFQLFNLYSCYKSLLKYSDNSLEDFKKGFNTILHMNTISLNSELVDKCFKSFFKEISFQNFINIYGNIQNLLFIQTIVDYVAKLFTKVYRTDYLSAALVFQIFKDQMQQSQAAQIRSLIWQFWNRKDQQGVQLQEIIEACQQSNNLCRKFFNIITKGNK